jgi:hypothetical protein
MTRFASLVIACVVAGCGTDDPVSSMTISVFKSVPDQGCRAQLPSDELDPALSDKLTFTRCGSGAAPRLVAGTDEVTLVIDYGALEFAESTDVQAPTVTLLLDGASVSASAVPVVRRDRRRAFFELTFAAPARPGTQLAIMAQAATGFSRTVPASYPLIGPQPAIAIEQCASAPSCSIVAAVGTIAVHVTVEGGAAQTVSLVSVVDGISQPGSQAVDVKAPIADNRVEGVVYPQVPQGSSWVLQAVLGSATATSPPIALTQPTISATLACGSSCTAGAQAALVLTAPRGIHPASGSASVTIGGTPLISNGAVPLTVENIAADTISGTLTITFPASPGESVIIDSLVAGYPATTISTSLQ